MIKVAITGNIASGKSQVEKILISLGFKVADSDKINNDLLVNNSEVISGIKKEFGLSVFDCSGQILKPKIGEIVFNNPEKKRKLENILHKKIFEEINQFFEKNKSEKLVFVSIPLLFEVNKEGEFDKIIFVSADEKIRLKRLIARNNYTEEYAKKRIQSQDREENKIKKSDFIILNIGDFQQLQNSVEETLKKLLNFC